MFENEPIFKVDYRVDGNALYRHTAKTIERIVPWGPDAGAWRTSAGKSSPFVPEIDLSFIEQNAWQAGGSRLPSCRHRVAAFRFLVDRWPEDVRDTVRSFPTAHRLLLQFLNAGGVPAWDLLESNLALGFLAAQAGAAHEIGLRRRTLAALFGFPETEHAVRLLRKVPTPWITPEFLAQLRLVMTEEPDVDVVIKHLSHINPLALEVLRDREMHASVAPDCIKHLCRIPAPTSQCDLIGRMRDLQECARRHGLPLPPIRKLSDLDRSAPRVEFPQPQLTHPHPPGSIAPLPAATVPHPGRQDRTPLVQSCRQSQRPDRYFFPEPPLPDLVALGIRIEAIRSQQELIAESEAMHHCARRDPSYARRVSAGSLYFYRMIGPERLTIALRCKRKYWAIDQLRGVCNRMATTDCAGPIWNWVESSWASSAAAERVNSAVILRQLAAPVRRRLHSTDQLSFSFEQSE